jgi:hypothetical protein
MGTSTRRRVAVLAGTAALAAALALGGCGSADDSGGTEARSAADAPARDEEATQESAAVPPAGADANRDAPGAGADLRVEQRQIIYTGSMTVRVTNVDTQAARAVALVTGAGGFVGGDRRTSDGTATQASLTLRVPADRFSQIVEELARLGEPQQREITTEDVTEETLDLDARIATQQARVASGRRLLAEADSLNDLILLEGELAKREADLASLEAKKGRLADLTTLSTITLVLLGPDAPDTRENEPETGFLVGLDAGWSAFLTSVAITLTVVGALVPWLIAFGVPALAVIWLIRRIGWRERTAPAPAADTTGSGSVPAGGQPAGDTAYPRTAPAPRSPAEEATGS